MSEINKNTQILWELESTSVLNAISSLKRDIEAACSDVCAEGITIVLIQKELPAECFMLQKEDDRLILYASDDLGFIYGIYKISREFLGILPFWFWNDQVIEAKEGYAVADDYSYASQPFRVRYRGWFINDEVLLHTWKVHRRADEPWKMAFEALLRLGGNIVIPGTDQNSRKYHKLALSMGLMVTHHHAEPLGACMFARAYPELTPSYDAYAKKFHQLWKSAIDAGKHEHILWNLGFRGQGDYPFWENDPRYKTDEARGALMSRLIGLQYDMVKKAVPDAVCSTNLYGENIELYKKGYLRLPEDVIKIWADNGYGEMVSRRQNNHNPRIYSLPAREDFGRHGIYYHVSFYDLQAANHMTMLPNSPEFVRKKLLEAMKSGAGELWIINGSNIKPHVYFLDLIARIWKDGDVDVTQHRMDYVESYYGKNNAVQIAGCLKAYKDYALAYGPHQDDHAGEQFSNHVARILICQFMKNKTEPSQDLLWATKAETLSGQIVWYKNLCQKAANGYKKYLRQCEETACMLDKETEVLFRDSILLQVQIHFYCFSGAYKVCLALESALDGNEQKAFYCAGKARKDYLFGNSAMRNREHGKWHNFYANECLTDIKQTAWVLRSLMAYIRTMDDGPHYYKWQRDFLYSEEDRRVMLIMNMENHLEDLEIFELMEERWG